MDGASPRRWGLPVTSGLLLAVAFPPLHLVVPSFIALVPLAVWLEGLERTQGDVRRAFRGGVVTGAVAWGLLLAWIPPALWGWSWLALPSYLLAVLSLALVVGGASAAVRWSRVRVGVPLVLALPVAWTAGEWLRAHLPGTLAFPWLELGASLTGYPSWVGIAELVGTRGVSFWLAAVSGLLTTAWCAETRPKARPAAAAVILALSVPSWGVWRASSLDMAPLGTVAVVQLDSHRSPRADGSGAGATLRALARLAPEIARAGVDLVVLPEAPLGDTIGGSTPAPSLGALLRFTSEVGAPVILGALGAPHPGDLPGTIYNSAFLLRPEETEGAVEADGFRYDKHHLVPLVERVPGLPIPGLARDRSGYGVGRGWPVAFVDAGLSVGVLICYESAFSDAARRLRSAGADLLVNLTNDRWFGGPSPGSRTHALWQHPAHLVMRAIETRTSIARAADTGFSLFVDPTGRVFASTALFEERVLVRPVVATEGVTLFVRFGDVIGLASLVAILLVMPVGRRSRHRLPYPG